MPLVVLVAACGGAPAASPPAAPAQPVASPGPGEWATWSHAQKLAYMQTTFIREEQKVFTAFEPVRFTRLECRTCHGVHAEERGYEMPNPDLPRLVGGKEGFGELADKQPAELTFMQASVVPETARLLGLPAFDMAKHVGFSCFQCHTRSDKPDQLGRGDADRDGLGRQPTAAVAQDQP